MVLPAAAEQAEGVFGAGQLSMGVSMLGKSQQKLSWKPTGLYLLLLEFVCKSHSKFSIIVLPMM